MRLAAWIITLVAVLLVPATATANTGGYARSAWAGCGGGFNSGTWDDQGRVYVPCGNPTSIGVYEEAGARVQEIHLDYFVSDVAPTDDGRYLYLATTGETKRLARQADGTYAADPSWQPSSYSLWGSSFRPMGRFVDTDARGRVYVSDGYWSNNQTHTVLVYEPDGRLVTRFGQWKKLSWDLGSFSWALGGVAVSDDGSTVYTTEAGNNRIQTWRRDAGKETYSSVASFGGDAANDPNREGACNYTGWQGWFAAPYDIALDEAGSVYVVNTTCKQVLKFAPGLGALQANLDVRFGTGTHPRPHGFALGRDGTVYVGENHWAWRPNGGSIPVDGGPAARPAPAPDPAPEPRPDVAVLGADPEPAAPAPSDPAPTTDGTVTGGGSIGSTRDVSKPRVQLSRVRVVRARGLALVVLATKCNERCRVDVTAIDRRRVIARRAGWRMASRATSVALPVRRVLRPRSVTVRIVVRDIAGNTTRLVRTVRA